jgi:hypothetical protein
MSDNSVFPSVVEHLHRIVARLWFWMCRWPGSRDRTTRFSAHSGGEKGTYWVAHLSDSYQREVVYTYALPPKGERCFKLWPNNCNVVCGTGITGVKTRIRVDRLLPAWAVYVAQFQRKKHLYSRLASI